MAASKPDRFGEARARAVAPILPGTGRGAGAAGRGGFPGTLRPETVAARRLRRDLSLPEAMLWQRLRRRQAGANFRRQHPIGPYVVDFYCRAAGPVIEIDGEAHDRGDRPGRDDIRLRFLREQGLRVVRITARRVIADCDGVAAAIAALVATPLHQPAADPPPRAGEDLVGPAITARGPASAGRVCAGEDIVGPPITVQE